MAVRYYCGVPDECTEEQAKQFSKLLEKIGVKIVFMHSECYLPTTMEFTAEEVDEAERQDPSGCNFPLQPNCFYSYTPLDGSPNPTRHPIVKVLTQKPKRILERNKIMLNCSLPQEKDYKDVPFEVHKDLVFVDETSGREVGWYNKRANIIWTSDLFHFLDNTKALLPTIVGGIIEYNRSGRLSDLLTIGADPEFEVIGENDQFVEAHTLFGENGISAEIGYDGHSSTGELRPKPERSPLGLTRNIKRLVRKLNSLRMMDGTKVWVGGGVHVTTGGHIHFGMRGVTQDLKELLWDMVAGPVLEFQTEKRKTGETSNWQRGSGGNMREQPHGTEWRPLPSFIVDEEITAAVLSTSYAIVKSWRYYNYRNTTRPITIEHYRNIPLYGAFKEQIESFIKMFVKKETPVKLHKKDIFSEWKLDKVAKQYTVDIISQADWLQTYFTPVNARVKKPVKLEIRFSGEAISTFGLKSSCVEQLIQFANDHYLPEVQVNEKLPRGQSRPIICLPSPWFHMTGKEKFCEDFKNILKNIILTLGGVK